MLRSRGICCVLCFLPILLTSQAGAVNSDIPTVEALPGADNFIEDKVTRFSCSLENGTTEVRFGWTVRDPKSGLPTLFLRRWYKHWSGVLPTLSFAGPATSSNGTTFLALQMRRDFSGFDLVCQVGGGGEGALRLPKVKEAVAIEEVRLSATTFLPSQDVKLFCDVRATRAPKSVLIATSKVGVVPMQLLSRNTSVFHYTVNLGPLMRSRLKNVTLQCIANTRRYYSSTGRVWSSIALLSVPFFRFLRSNEQVQVVLRTRPVTLYSEVHANPVPRPSDFSVSSCLDESELCSPLVIALKVRFVRLSLRPAQQHFGLLFEFVPPRSGYYRIHFHSEMVVANSAVYRIQIVDSLEEIGADEEEAACSALRRVMKDVRARLKLSDSLLRQLLKEQELVKRKLSLNE